MEDSKIGKAGQLQRDFGLPSPRKRLYAGLRRRDDREVTPLQLSVAGDRFRELAHLDWVEALIVLLMRGARIEVLCAVLGGITPQALAASVRDHLKQISDAALEALAASYVRTVIRV